MTRYQFSAFIVSLTDRCLFGITQRFIDLIATCICDLSLLYYWGKICSQIVNVFEDSIDS